MKALIKYTLLIVMPLLMMGGLLTSCEDDGAENAGTPVIHYIRVTDPAKSDSLLEAGSLGGLIAIVGDNLGDARQLWFNDQEANLNPAFVTNETILVTIPNQAPDSVTDQMVIRFGNGYELIHNFEISISAPVIERIVNEYVPEGGELVVLGDFYFEPITVTFTGEEGPVEAEVASLEQTELRVIVPEGAVPGPITVETNFGSATSTQYFRDDRNVFATFDSGTSGWWNGSQYIVAEDPDIEPISGSFMRINRTLGQYEWLEFFVGQRTSELGLGTRNIPDDAIENPRDYYLTFEIATISPFTQENPDEDEDIVHQMKIYIGNDVSNERAGSAYAWQPELDTDGEWQTVNIPFEDIMANAEVNPDPDGYDVSFWWDSPNDSYEVNYALDNLRVTPK